MECLGDCWVCSAAPARAARHEAQQVRWASAPTPHKHARSLRKKPGAERNTVADPVGKCGPYEANDAFDDCLTPSLDCLKWTHNGPKSRNAADSRLAGGSDSLGIPVGPAYERQLRGDPYFRELYLRPGARETAKSFRCIGSGGFGTRLSSVVVVRGVKLTSLHKFFRRSCRAQTCLRRRGPGTQKT